MSYIENTHTEQAQGTGMTSYRPRRAYTPELELRFEGRFVTIPSENHKDGKSMSRNDLCFCGSGKKQKKCHRDIHEKSIVAELLRGYVELDNAITSMSEEYGIIPFCEKGCDACCDEYFYITMAEYFTIRHYIETNTPDKMARYVDKAVACWDELQHAAPEEYRELTSGSHRSDRDKRNLMKFMPCVFLEDHECSIYPVRPEICRNYGSTADFTPCAKMIDAGVDESNVDSYLVPMVSLLQRNTNTFGISSKRKTVGFSGYPIFYWFSDNHKRDDTYKMGIGLPSYQFLSQLR